MTGSPDYRKYLDESFKNIDNNFRDVKNSLQSINNHLEKLNGTVADHDKSIALAKAICEVQRKKSDNNEARINKIENDLEEYRFFKKYPKIFFGIIVIILLGIVATFFNSTFRLRNLQTEVDMINIPVRTRSGVVKWLPSGVVIDSLNALEEEK